MNIKKYKTLIFDFGGVIMNINPQLSINEFIKLLGQHAVQELISEQLTIQYEQGLLSTNEFYTKVCSKTNTQVIKEEFFNAWNKMLLDYEPKRISKLQQLAKTHKLILLSNTNECHYNFFKQKLYNTFKLNFEDIFSSIYLSYKLKLSKPDIRIFQHIIDKENITPEETLFIEDTKENVEVAQELNIETLLIKRNSNFYEYL